jgi:hypothetical protein
VGRVRRRISDHRVDQSDSPVLGTSHCLSKKQFSEIYNAIVVTVERVQQENIGRFNFDFISFCPMFRPKET